MTAGGATAQELEALVRAYFTAVDAEDLDGVLATLTPDCRFSVETHGVRLTGHDQIAHMFKRLWADHAAVLHDQFRMVPDPKSGRIAAQFRVLNTEHDGSQTHKSNCNFFTVRGGQFSEVQVYMAGPNTLT